MNLAVGFFDGVHLGHRRILADADAAFTFRNHPTTVFAPARVPQLLMTAEMRVAAIGEVLRSKDVARVRLLDFTPAFAAMTAADFADALRRDYPDLDTIFCGPDWTFGAGGLGTASFLRARGFHVEVVPFLEVAGKPVSSTRVRQALTVGDLADATACLGHPWCVTGAVIPGKGLGRTLGVPTLNVKVPVGLIQPPCGVYAVDTCWGRAVANWGLAPTLGEKAWREPMLEVHLLEQVPDETPVSLSVAFRSFLRPERAFASLVDLKRQIEADRQSALKS